MTTQSITAVVGSPSMSRTFSATATDGQWDGNLLVDTLASVNLGLVMPMAVIDHVQLQYTAGSCLWRIQSSQTLVVKRWGYGAKDGFIDWEMSKIPQYTVQPDDILTVYPLAVNGGANTSTALAWLDTTRGHEAFGNASIIDATPSALTSLVNNQSLGDYAFNSTLTGITIQCEEGATLDSVSIVDQTGGTIWTGYGGVRLNTAGGTTPFYNFRATGLNIPIQKGFKILVQQTTG